jgi:hypothetical protein
MSSIKCPTCGLINFATATECKRCKQNLESPSYLYWQGNNPVEPPKPDWSRLQTVPAVRDDGLNLGDCADPSHTVGNILFAIYLALNTIVLIYAVFFMSSASMREVLKLVTVPKSPVYLASFEPFYYLAFPGIIIFLPTSIILFARLCMKSVDFLKMVVIYLLAEFVYSLVQAFLIFSLAGDLRAKHIPQFDVAADQMQALLGVSIISILFTFIWFRYFNTSERARLVFEWGRND